MLPTHRPNFAQVAAPGVAGLAIYAVCGVDLVSVLSIEYLTTVTEGFHVLPYSCR